MGAACGGRSVTVYAFMQAMGLINGHVEDCAIRAEVERARKSFKQPGADVRSVNNESGGRF
jgi:hypothetical protein